MTKRRAAVAGQFYPGNPKEVERMLDGLVDEGEPRRKALGVIAPHAGWVYSGRGAGILYSRVEIPRTVLIMCPNHRGEGADAAIMREGSWELPGGDVPLAPELAGLIMERAPFVRDDPRAHRSEHSLEVHLPFIRRFRPDFRLVPISLFRLGLADCAELGRAIAGAIDAFGDDVLVVASSDMTHFESAESAREKDMKALEAALALEPERLLRTVRSEDISMCGAVPAAAMLYQALERGATRAELLDYRNSGDVTGDRSNVVAYASVIVE